ncbi:MAG TPA: DoxX family protein [Puia sp.]|jgi:putative oxidoreductase|nr:DoxX family protein [Puia sp.]
MAINSPDKYSARDIVILITRIWLGYIMIKNGRFFFKLIYSEEDRAFFTQWFGKGLHFPFPLLMAYLAKGAEFFGGLLVLIGMFTRVGASLIAFTMFIATVTANIGKNWDVDGTITVSICMMALIIIYWGGGKYSLDSVARKNWRAK